MHEQKFSIMFKKEDPNMLNYFRNTYHIQNLKCLKVFTYYIFTRYLKHFDCQCGTISSMGLF